MGDKERDEALREMAANRGCRLVKSRRRKTGGDFGLYGLADRKTGKPVFGFAGDGLTATSGEIEDFLRGSAASTWKSSVAASAKAGKTAKAQKPAPIPPAKARSTRKDEANRRSAPRPEPKARPEESVRPEPAREPPRLRIRTADSVDSEHIALLLSELGSEATADEVAERLQRLARGGEPVLLARQGEETLGCLTWHVTPNIHRPWPVGRITMLVVAASARRRGVGRALIEAAEDRMIQRGCGLIEVTSNVKRRSAHAFYAKLGFERTSQRFSRALNRD